MQNALIKNLPIETAAKTSAADNAHWPNVDEAPPVHHEIVEVGRHPL